MSLAKRTRHNRLLQHRFYVERAFVFPQGYSISVGAKFIIRNKFWQIGVAFLSKNGNDYETYPSEIEGSLFGNTLRTARKNDVQQLCDISLPWCKTIYV